jgi:aspartate ammonia-lyase
MMPIIAHCLLESIGCEANTCRILAENCVDGIKANEERCRQYAERSPSLMTTIAPTIGYDKAGEIVKEALTTRKSIIEILLNKGILTPTQLKEKLNPERMTKGGRI